MKPEASNRHKAFLSILCMTVTSFMLSGCIELMMLSSLYMGSSPAIDVDRQVAELRAGYNYSHIPDHIDIKGLSEPQVDNVLKRNNVFVRQEMPPKFIQNQYWKVWKVERWMPTTGGHFFDYNRYILFIDGRAVNWFTKVPPDYEFALAGADTLPQRTKDYGKCVNAPVSYSLEKRKVYCVMVYKEDAREAWEKRNGAR